MHTRVHNHRHLEVSVNERYELGYRIVTHSNRQQPYTIWAGNQVVKFLSTEEEVYDFVRGIRKRRS